MIAQCKAGIIGSFPCLNAREGEGEPNMLEIWLKKINEELDRYNQKNPDNPAAPYAVNHIVHKSNVRLEQDIDICAKWKAPVWITSLGARPEVNQVAHQANGIVLHDIINNFFAKKAIDKGADGLVAVELIEKEPSSHPLSNHSKWLERGGEERVRKRVKRLKELVFGFGGSEACFKSNPRLSLISSAGAPQEGCSGKRRNSR